MHVPGLAGRGEVLAPSAGGDCWVTGSSPVGGRGDPSENGTVVNR